MNKILQYSFALFHNDNFLLLLLCVTVTTLGDWAQRVALTTYVFKTTHSLLNVSVLFLVITLPDVLLAPCAGVLVDRKNPKTLLLATEVFQGLGTMGLLLLFKQQWVVLILVFCNASLKYLSEITVQVLVPKLVTKEALLEANAVLSVAGSVMRILGPIVGGIITQILAMQGIFLFNALTFFVTAVLYLGLTRSLEEKKSGVDTPSHYAFLEYGEDLRLFHRNGPVFLTTLLFSVALIATGIFNVIVLKLINLRFGNGTLYNGFISSMGLGILLGGILLGILRIRKQFVVYAWAFMGTGALMIGLLFVNQTLFLAMALAMGSLNSFYNILDETILQQHCPEVQRGKLFAIHNFMLDFACLLSYLVAGIVADLIPFQGLLWGTAAILLGSGGLYLVKQEQFENKPSQ